MKLLLEQPYHPQQHSVAEQRGEGKSEEKPRIAKKEHVNGAIETIRRINARARVGLGRGSFLVFSSVLKVIWFRSFTNYAYAIRIVAGSTYLVRYVCSTFTFIIISPSELSSENWKKSPFLCTQVNMLGEGNERSTETLLVALLMLELQTPVWAINKTSGAEGEEEKIEIGIRFQ